MSVRTQSRPGTKKSKPRKRHVLTRDFYAAIVDAYRLEPGNHARASAATGLTWRTCKRAWEEGMVKEVGHGGLHADWAIPIKDVVGSEKEAARMRLAQQAEDEAKRASALTHASASAQAPALAEATVRHEDERELARRDAILRRQEWGKAAKSIRMNAAAVLRLHSMLLEVLLKRAVDIRTELENSPMTGQRALDMVRRIGLSVRMSSEALESAQRIENLSVGSPTEILGLVAAGASEFDFEEAEELVERAYSVTQRVRERRAAKARVVVDAEPEDVELAAGEEQEAPAMLPAEVAASA